MIFKDNRWLRLGVLTRLVERSPCKLGRTAVMKLAFLLHTVKGVPLDYNFRLYTYGPFDGNVLNYLAQAETLKAVESNMVHFNGGYGYEFSPGVDRGAIMAFAGPELDTYDNEVEWALREFASKTAGDLELLATIVYADRDALRQSQRLPFVELCRQVKAIKPRFADEYILKNIASLSEMGLLLATVSNGSPA